MDRLSLAEAALAAAAASSGAVVVPGRVTSPMDCCHTVPIARAVVDGCSERADRERATGAVASVPDTALDAEMTRLAAGPLRGPADGKIA